MSLVYNKLFTISSATNKKFNIGKIVNFVEVDAKNLYLISVNIASIANVPLVLSISFVFLFIYLGLSFFAGIGVFILGVAS